MHTDFVSKKVFDILWGVFFWTPLLTSTHFYKVFCVNLSFYQVIQSSVMLQRSMKSIIVPLGPFPLSFISNRSFTYIFSISCECSDYHRNPPTKKGFHFPETLFTLSKKPSRFPAGRPINFHYAVWKAPLKSVLLPGRCACLSVTFRVRGAKRKNVERHATRRLAEIFINKPCFEKKETKWHSIPTRVTAKFLCSQLAVRSGIAVEVTLTLLALLLAAFLLMWLTLCPFQLYVVGLVYPITN